MTFKLKEELEKHFFWVALGIAATSCGTGIGVSEYVRVVPRSELISALEKRNLDLEQQLKDRDGFLKSYEREISKIKELQLQLNQAQGGLTQWKTYAESLGSSHAELQRRLEVSASNCSVLGQLKATEQKKDSVERSLQYDLVNDSGAAKLRVLEHRRMVEEYQARLLQLQSKLSCQSSS